jgi:prevent-host-death family protein
MKTMPAGQFKARCLKVMDDVQSTLEPVVITKKGRPVAN